VKALFFLLAPALLPVLFGAPPAPKYDYFGQVMTIDASQTTYTFTGMPIGNVSTKRRVTCIVATQSSVANTHTSMTGNAGAVTFNKLQEAPVASDTSQHLSLWEASAAVATGTTIDLLFTPAAAPTRAKVACWAHRRGAALSSGFDNTANPLHVLFSLVQPKNLIIAANNAASGTDITPGWDPSFETIDFGVPIMDRTSSLNISGGRHVVKNSGPYDVFSVPGASSQRLVAALYGPES
jgi:hypothetical protein